MYEPRYTESQATFAMTCAVDVNILASPEIVWSLLTDAHDFPRWNSTVERIEGEIREGESLKLHVPGTRRTFTPKVSGLVAGRRMVWSNGVATIFRGVRTFLLAPVGTGNTQFTMLEQFSGAVFAISRSMLPDFRPIFETFANDLKREAERIANQRILLS